MARDAHRAGGAGGDLHELARVAAVGDRAVADGGDTDCFVVVRELVDASGRLDAHSGHGVSSADPHRSLDDG